MATIAAGGSLTAASPTFEFQTRDAGVVGVEVTGTWTGTITFEARVGTAWANAQVFTVAGVAAAATTTANVSRLINAAGFSSVRANFSTPTSGSPTVIFTGSPESMGGSGGGGGGGAVTIADGADVALGSTTDAGVVTDTSGTALGFLRGLVTLIAGTLRVGGNIAHDGVDSGNPVKLGLRAIAHGTNPTAVAAADRTDWFANRAGVPFMIGGHPNIVTVRANYAAAQTDTAIVTVAAGLKIVVTRLTVTASKANTVNTSVVIGFGTANTPTTTGVLLAHSGIDPGGGVNIGTGGGILGVGADNEDLRITSSVPTSGSIDVCVSYHTVES